MTEKPVPGTGAPSKLTPFLQTLTATWYLDGHGGVWRRADWETHATRTSIVIGRYAVGDRRPGTAADDVPMYEVRDEAEARTATEPEAEDQATAHSRNRIFAGHRATLEAYIDARLEEINQAEAAIAELERRMDGTGKGTTESK
jgi:hypothetical protein